MLKQLNSLWCRLVLAYAAPLLLFAIIGAISLFTIHRLLSTLELEQQTRDIVSIAFDLKHTMERLEANKRAHHLLGDPEFKDQFQRDVERFPAALKTLRRLLGDNGEYAVLIDDIDHRHEDWKKLVERDFALFAGSPAQSRAAWDELIAQLHLRQAIVVANQIQTDIDAIVEAQSARLAERSAEVKRAARDTAFTIGATIPLAIILSLSVASNLRGGIARPMKRLREAASKLRKGEFTTVAPSGPDEIAELTRSFNLLGIALTEREDMRQTTERRFRALVSATTHLLWTATAEGEAGDMSTWRQFTGQSAEEVAGMGWLDAVHPDDRPSVDWSWETAVIAKTCFDEEFRVRRHDSVYRAFSGRAVPIYGEDNAVLEWVCSCTDITERKKQESLRRDKEAAEAANRAKSEFLAKMSHELRTPLNAVIGMSKMLLTRRFGALSEKQGDYINDICQAGEHLLNLINRILDLSKVEAGQIDVVRENVCIGQATAQVVSTLSALAESKRIELKLSGLEPDLPLMTDASLVKQVLFNLISNAIKFTRPGGKVAIACRWAAQVARNAEPVDHAEAQAARVDIIDNGIGIDPKEQDLIWHEFYQSPAGRRHAREGTGLGLAVTRRIVSLLGGEIWFTSELGKGSCFSVVLPANVPQMALSGAKT